jgi:hypothetical protein
MKEQVSLRATGGSEAISPFGKSRRLLRRFAPRNDTLNLFQHPGNIFWLFSSPICFDKNVGSETSTKQMGEGWAGEGGGMAQDQGGGRSSASSSGRTARDKP